MRDEMLHLPVGAVPRICAIILLAAGAVCIAQNDHPASAQKEKPGAPATASADAARQTTNPAEPAKEQRAAGGENERKKQIADESTQLLSMALALKAEVDKTNKDTLSINVIRKADEIEKLARTVKEKMKQSSGGAG